MTKPLSHRALRDLVFRKPMPAIKIKKRKRGGRVYSRDHRGQFADGGSVDDDMSDADKAAMSPETFANPAVKGAISGTADLVSAPGKLMAQNPYYAGSEEASWYEDQRNKGMGDWAPQAALATMGTGAVAGVPVRAGETVLGSGAVRTNSSVFPEGEARVAAGEASNALARNIPKLRTTYWGGESGRQYSHTPVLFKEVPYQQGKTFKFRIDNDGTPIIEGSFLPQDKHLGRAIQEYLSPLKDDEYIRTAWKPDDYYHLQNDTHLGSMNHATNASEAGLSVAKHLEFPQKYAYKVTGTKIGTGSDAEPILETSSAKPVGPLLPFAKMAKQFDADQEKHIASLGLSPQQAKALQTITVPMNPKKYSDYLENGNHEIIYGLPMDISSKAKGGRVGMSDGGTPNPFDEFDSQPVSSASAPVANPFDEFDAKSEPESSGIASYIPKAISDIPHEAYEATANQVRNIGQAYSNISQRHAEQAKKDASSSGSFFDPSAIVGSLKDVGDTGKALVSAASIPVAPVQGAAESLIGHPMAAAEHIRWKHHQSGSCG